MEAVAPANILLVNDRPAQLTAWQAVLADLGRLVTARSGVEALEHLLAGDFAVILLDVHMPNMDGFETAALIRQRPRSQHTPILFVTAINTAEHDRAQGYALGAVDYIFTPIVPEILRAKVKAFVDLYKKSQQVAAQAAELASLNRVLETRLNEIKGLNDALTATNASLRAETAERHRAEAEVRQAHDALARAHHDLRRAHAELEDRVLERTADLASANRRLQHEVEERKRVEIALRRSSEAERLARQAAERAAERTGRLQAATAALAQALTPGQVADVIVKQAALAFGANAGRLAVLTPDGGALHLIQSFGLARYSREAAQPIAMSASLPLTEAVGRGQPVCVEDRDRLMARYPHLADQHRCEALIAIPLMLNARPLGGLVLEFDRPQALEAPDLELLMTLGQQCAQALERARLFAEAQALNADLEARVQARTAELQAANAELDHSREQLRQLAAHVEALRETERVRIAREIHDDLGGALTGLKMDVTRMRKSLAPGQPELRERLEALSQQIDATVQSVRRIAMELRPALLDDFGLAAAIEWQLQEFEKRSGLQTRLQVDLAEVGLSPDATTAVFRVFQEALTNVARHAQATEVSVCMRENGGRLLLEVRDNGRGIRASEIEHTRSFGLAGMRERIQLLQGEFGIEGQPGHGTTVLVKVPLQRE